MKSAETKEQNSQFQKIKIFLQIHKRQYLRPKGLNTGKYECLDTRANKNISDLDLD
jgi:hypothetical protein